MSEWETKRVWVTKWTLSTGIEHCNVQIKSSSPCAWLDTVTCLSPGEYHLTREAAIAKAEEMRTKKIASLKKQIKKLEAMDFTKVK